MWYSQQSRYKKQSCQGKSWLLPVTVRIWQGCTEWWNDCWCWEVSPKMYNKSDVDTFDELCFIVYHEKYLDLRNNLRIFLIFCKKGTVWKDGTLFDKNNVPSSKWGKIVAQNPKTTLMSFSVLCTMMKRNSVLVSTPCQIKYSLYLNLGKSESLHQFNTCNNKEK